MKSWYNDKSVGDHMQLAGTLAEIVGHAGFTYASLQANMFENQDVVFNHRLYAADGKIYMQSSDTDKKNTDYINSMRGVGAWRVLKGDAVK